MTINPIIVQTGGGGGGLSYTVNSGLAYPANVTSFTLPANLTSIGDYAFYNNSSLASIVLPAGVTTIGTFAFYGCSSLASVNIPDGVITIATSTFRNCLTLASIVLPAGMIFIGTTAFSDCTSLMELTSLATKPPNLQSNSLTGVPANCSIRVPAGSVAAYKAAANWSARAAYITAI